MNDIQAVPVAVPAARTASPGGEGETRQTMFHLLRAAHAIEEHLDAAVATVGLSMPKFQVLAILTKAGNSLPLSELAGKLSCVRSNVTQLVDRLEADGLVRRVDDPGDRRSIRAELTELGRERQEAAAELLEGAESEFSEALGGLDRDALRRLLEALK